MTEQPTDFEDIAVRLAMAVRRLRSRLRAEARGSLNEMPITQMAILKHLSREGSSTATQLAAVEHVSQQAIAQSIAALRERDLIQTTPDPTDRRKTLISLSPPGSEMMRGILASRDAWLVRAIESSLDAAEMADLNRTIEILERLADAQTGAKFDFG